MTTSQSVGPGGPPRGGATTAESESAAFEREYPGSSWLASRLLRELEVVGGMAEALIAGVGRRYGLSHAAFNALAVIEGSGGPIPAGEVGTRMHITSGSATSVLDTLERKGYIKRLADPSDRRRVLVDVTPPAQELLDALLPEVQQVCTTALGGFNERTLSQVLKTLTAIRSAILEVPGELPAPAPRRRPPRLTR